MDRIMVENHRLALFGRMIMGVAHEVDNHLSVILGFAELIQISRGGEKKTLDGVAKILSAGERINTIMRHFSQYVRPHAPLPEKFSPSDALRECLVYARYDLGRNNVVLNIPEPFPSFLLTGDRSDFALALLALLFNGSEAMAAKGGTLRLDVVPRESAWNFTVTDKGPGIPPGIVGRIFEEGFTTKEGSYHTGMGLPLAKYLAAEIGGTVTVANLPEGGCEAVLRIPAS